MKWRKLLIQLNEAYSSYLIYFYLFPYLAMDSHKATTSAAIRRQVCFIVMLLLWSGDKCWRVNKMFQVDSANGIELLFRSFRQQTITKRSCLYIYTCRVQVASNCSVCQLSTGLCHFRVMPNKSRLLHEILPSYIIKDIFQYKLIRINLFSCSLFNTQSKAEQWPA